MTVNPDEHSIYEAIAGFGDLDAALDSLFRLPPGTPRRGWMAARLLGTLLRTTDIVRDVTARVSRYSHVEELIRIADQDPPPDVDWPRARAYAQATALMTAATRGQLADPAAGLAELDRLEREHGADPALRGLILPARMALRMTLATQIGDESHYAHVGEEMAQLSALLPGNPELAAQQEVMNDFIGVMTTRQRGGDVLTPMRALQEKVHRLLPNSPLRAAMDETMTLAAPLAAAIGGSADAPTPQQVSAVEALIASATDSGDTRQVMRHLAAGAAILADWDGADLARIDAAIGHFRTALELGPAGPTERLHVLTGLAAALAKRSEITNDLADVDSAETCLLEARELAGGPHNPQWSVINGFLAEIGLHRPGGETSRYGLDALRSTAWTVLLQDNPIAAGFVARDAADSASRAARRCIVDDDIAGAIRALDGGRSLMLFAATEFRDVEARLEQVGKPELAERWRGAVTDGTTKAMPTGLRNEVLTALAEKSGLLDPPSLEDIQDALYDLDADALVYLAPTDGNDPGFALIAPAEGPPGYMSLMHLTTKGGNEVEQYLGMLSNRDLSSSVAQMPDSVVSGPSDPATVGPRPTRDLAAQQAAADLVNSLDPLCRWAWRVAIGPIFENYLPRLRTARQARQPAESAPDRPLHLVLVPMGSLALVPWHAARADNGAYALETVALSQAASARMLCRVRGGLAGAADLRRAHRRRSGYSHAAGPGRRARRGVRCASGLLPRRPICRQTGRRADESGRRRDRGRGPRLAHHASARRRRGPAPGLPRRDRGRRAGPDLVSGTGRRRADRRAGDHRADVGTRPRTRARRAGSLPHRSVHRWLRRGVQSRDGAFLAGGGRSVLSTLWSIPDQETSALMFMFHHSLIKLRLPAWEALRRAQLWMLDPAREAPGSMPPALRAQLDGADATRIDAWADFVHWGQ